MSISAEEVMIGKNVIIEPTATIRGVSGKAKKVTLGDNIYIGESVQIICDEFSLGDYSKIHHHTNIHGYKPCTIGHNAWIGQYSLIDSIGGTTIGNNCGIGAHSQLWSHIKFGDTLEGCKFLENKSLTIGQDVWFVGHCIVSPITAEDKSMALVGSVVTHDMKFNEIYAGCPAKSISGKIGFQFVEISIDEKIARMKEYIRMAEVDKDLFDVVETERDFKGDGRIYFAVKSRTYTKTLHPEEIKLMKFLLPEKAKFTPSNEQ